MKKKINNIKKMVACILAVVMMLAYLPATQSYAASSTDYASAIDMEFNKLYVLKLYTTDEFTGEHLYTWYKITPNTSAETKVEIMTSIFTGYGIKIKAYDSLLQEVKIRDKNKLDLEKGVTYYLRLDSWNGSETEVSFMLKTAGNEGGSSGGNNENNQGNNENNQGNNGNNQGNSGNNQGNNGNNQGDSGNTSTNPGNATDGNVATNPGNTTGGNATTNPGSNPGNSGSDIGDVDSDFWNENDNNGSDVYDGELPVPEISDVENGNSSITVSWSCDDPDSIDGYYVYRSKDGNDWNKIATITDTEVMDYEDGDIVEGDACGYIVCSFAGNTRSENSVPEYTCFLKKVSIKSVKSNASKKLTVKWTTNPKASGYQIRVSTTKSFTTTTTDTKRVNSASSSAQTISKLKGGRKYYVQIRTYRTYNGEYYYSEWSPTKSVKVKR